MTFDSVRDALESIECFCYDDASFAARYDAVRPRPPGALLDAMIQFARVTRPELVVDLGSGTGLSTRVWEDRAASVIGVEPAREMRRLAERRNGAEHVRFVDGLAEDTGLPDGCADIVTASSAINWFDLDRVLDEVARILRPGGIFGAFHHDWPPAVDPEIDRAFIQHVDLVDELSGRKGGGSHSDVTSALLDALNALQSFPGFSFVRELHFHDARQCDAHWIIELARSSGSFARLRANGIEENQMGLDTLAAVANQLFGTATSTLYFGYTLRVAIKAHR